MSVSGAILLGLIQGLTEFLPISSSGHLAVTQHFLPGFHQPGVLFDIILHLGTLLAVLIYFRSDIAFLIRGFGGGKAGAAGRRLMVFLVLGTIPIGLVGTTFSDVIERSFTQLAVVGGGLLFTGAILLFSTRLSREDRGLDDVSAKDTLVIGLAQSAALLPGVSRSGSTIVAGLARGLSREAAARFSFLLSIPAVLGAAVWELPKAGMLPAEAWGSYASGFIAAFVVGYFAIAAVLRCLAARRFHLFGYYCLAAGGGILVYVASNLS